MARKMFSMGEEEKILNKCPICGSKLEYTELCQYEKVYCITKKGKITSRHKYKADVGSMECGYIICTNEECDFYTDCDLNVEGYKNINVFQLGELFMYTETELE